MDRSTDPRAPGALVPTLDHVVVLAHGEIDAVADAYRRLGFAITPRGHHSLGSSNNLAIFTDTYLELLGFEPGNDAKRPELWSDPAGLSGLVFRSPDPELVAATLREAGMAGIEPLNFNRPVDTVDGPADARFTVVHVPKDLIDNGRSFFCHHYTPELVWQAQWQDHPNGAREIVGFVIASAEPRRAAGVYARIFGEGLLEDMPDGVAFTAGTARVEAITPEAARARYGDAILPLSGEDRMIALAIAADLARTRTALDAGGVAYTEADGALVVPHGEAGGVALMFVAA